MSPEQTVAQQPSPDVTQAQTAPPSDPATPPDVPGYALEHELGRGGMGVVYRATQVGLNRAVALKLLPGAADPLAAGRFLAEAEAVAAVRHPHVVEVFQYGESAGRPFLAMELLTGGTLADRLQAGPMPPADAAALVADLADAVQAVHAVGTVHRDLKPGNVLFDAAGRPKVTDFGLAKRAAADDLTRTGAVLGTPAYMAPEQAAGRAKLAGPAADIYALGVILFECLTGRRPFEAPDAVSLLVKVATEPPPTVTSVAAAVPRDLDLICRKCLEKDPADRYPTAAALADDLRAAVAGRPVSVRPPTLAGLLRGWAKQNFGRAGWVLPIGLLAGFLPGLLFWIGPLSNTVWWWAAAYDQLPSADRPWTLALFRVWSDAVKIPVGVLLLVVTGGLGLWTARLVRTRGRDADIVAGLAVGLAAGLTAFTVGFGPFMLVQATFAGDAPRDLELLAWSAWTDGPRDGLRSAGMLHQAYPDLARLGYEDRVHTTRRKPLADVAAGIPVGLWVGQAVSVLVFVPFAVLATVTAGRLLRDRVPTWRLLAGYFERAAPVMCLAGMPAMQAASVLVVGVGRVNNWAELRTMMAWQGGTLALAVLAVYRGWPWPVRVVLHAAWLVAMFWW